MPAYKTIACLFALLAGAPTMRGDVIELTPSRDTSLYSDKPSFSNGAGDYLFAGATNNGVDYLRRALVAFDFQSLPAGAVLTGAELRLTVSRRPQPDAGSRDFSLHRMTSSWGEGTSDAPGEEGAGVGAAAEDASWAFRRQSPALSWTTPGGDFDPAASTAFALGEVGVYLVQSPGMVADVQGWIDGAPNEGWILLGDELHDATARRINSRNDPDTGPLLTLTYQVVPEPATLTLLLPGLALALARRRASPAASGSSRAES